MAQLAILGGPRVREKAFHSWPVVDESDRKAIVEVVESGLWGGIEQRKVPEFEKQFSAFQDCDYGVSCTNGTHALEIVLRALGVGIGDEVILPPYTFIATATAVLLNNGIPVFADIDPETYLIDPDKVEAAITPKTKAIIAVHIAGQPCDMDALVHISKKHGIPLVEDAAQAHGAEWAGQRVGSFGVAGTFSFQSSKNLTAGEGGMIVTNNQEIYDRCWSIHNVGRVPGGRWYEHPNLGANYRMTEWQAAILLSQMKKLPEQMQVRQANASYLTSKLEQIPGILAQKRPEKITSHGYHLYIFRYDSKTFDGISRNRFMEALSAEGIPCFGGYTPLYREKAFYACVSEGAPDYSNLHLPISEKASDDEGVWLTQPMLLGPRSDMDSIVQAVAKVYENRAELKDA
ncbi:MAG: DegT/DnrJ/EryC1/StrS family aminotransferase [Armatimonadetes bacterium]|nr:DegT/DnrJ/EryC1/StrS family aminotransferase [Armatimonadota bacterium]